MSQLGWIFGGILLGKPLGVKRTSRLYTEVSSGIGVCFQLVVLRRWCYTEHNRYENPFSPEMIE